MPAPADFTPTAARAQADTFDLQINRQQRAVQLNGEPLALGGRAFDLLATMAAQPGRVFTADELMLAVWPGRVVDETNLRAQVRKLRQALGAHTIVNVSGRGYAFAAPTRALRRPARAADLPSLAGAVLGRDEDIAAVVQLLADHRLVTLVGAGGIGKTRLALAVAEQVREHQADAVWWVELAPVRTPGQLGTAIAQATGVQMGSAVDGDVAARLGAALASAEGLLVLDSAEHVAAELAVLVQGIWPAARGLTMLVTSQQRLRLRAEQVYRLEPLAPQPALQLLLQRAQAIDQRFRLSEGQIGLATALCRQLDDIPLALELAGTRLPMLGLEALHQRLGERLRLLGDADGGAPERHHTLHAALAWSHALLSRQEQAVLRRLSVFAAPFRLESAQHVAADAELDALAVVQAVAALVDKSLLQQVLGAAVAGVAAPTQTVSPSLAPALTLAAPLPGPVRRYRLLETTRLFAAREIDLHDERQATECRHAQAMAALADQAQAAYWTQSDDTWMGEWRADQEDFSLGFDRAVQAGDAESAALIGEALQATANLSGDYAPVHERVDAALALLPQGRALARARLWNRASRRPVQGLSRRESACRRVQAWRLVGEPMGLARALAQAVEEHAREGDINAAYAALAELKTLEQEDWPPRQRVMGVAVALLNLGNYVNGSELKQGAMRSWLAFGQAGGLRRVCAQAWSNLARQELVRAPLLALSMLREATAEYRALGCQIDAAVNLGMQAHALFASGATAEARHTLEQALLSTDDSTALVNFVQTLAALALREGDVPTAARVTAAAQALSARLGNFGTGWDVEPGRSLPQAVQDAVQACGQAAAPAERTPLDPAALRQSALAWLRHAQ